MKLFHSILLGILFLLCAGQAYAQEITVKGVVTDASSGETVIGASVSIKGSTKGTITNINGEFTLKAVPPQSTLVFSFVGYKTQELPAKPVMQVVLQENVQALKDLVVIGYGSVKKEDLSGSVVAIKADEINRGAVTSPQELIQGKVPGLFVAPGSGQPGAGSTLRIRGGASLNASNDPLIVIDGIPVAGDAAPGSPNALATINPNDIETFTVLKDASATAIYGSRASNGVIIITTKKGAAGKFKVTYAGTFSLNHPYKRVPTLSANEFRKVMQEQYPNHPEANKLLQLYPDTSTNWQDAIYQAGLALDQNVSVSGTIAKVLPLRVSLGVNAERGTLKTSLFNRYTAAVNLSPKLLNNHLSVELNAKGTVNRNRYANEGAVSAAAFADPTKPIYTNDPNIFNGYWNYTTENGVANSLAIINPLSLLNDVNNSGRTLRSLGNLQLDYKVHHLEDLRLNLNLGYDVATSSGVNFVRPGSYQSALDGDFTLIGQGSTWDQLRRNLLLDFYANYATDLKALHSRLDVMAGYSWQHFYAHGQDITYSNTPTTPPANWGEDKKGWQYLKEQQRYQKEGSRRVPYENYLVSFFGRLNYNLLDRYLLTATLRRDGSSRFSANHRWGLFPSMALAWTLSNEPWMAPTRNLLSNLKLRLGYGVTGQQEIGDYLYITTYSTSKNPNSMYLGHHLIKPNGYSPDLKWESTTTYNIGLDYGFLKNRISGSLEVYRKHTTDLLNTVSAAAGTNFTNLLTANVGEMVNNGVEFNINAVAIDLPNFSWDLGYNITYNNSRITKLTTAYNPDYPGIDAGSAHYGSNVTVLQKHQVGHTPGTFWTYKQVYNANGKPIQNAYVDLNNDGAITEADRYLTEKSPMATVFMGLSSQWKYKQWDLGCNFRANIGNYLYNALAADNSTKAAFSNQGFLVNYYKAIYDTGFTQNNGSEQRASDLFLENASFLKLDNITLGYSFSSLAGMRLNGRLSASVQNVFTLTRYSGLDPEAPAIDNTIWPRPRVFTLGLNINF